MSEIFYGNVDVKIKSVHFYVQRNTDFKLNDTVIPFEIERLNVGGAMNLGTGVFTVPIGGIYHFEFRAMKGYDEGTIGYVDFQVNGSTISSSFITSTALSALSGISASFHLKSGDQVRLYKTAGNLNDNARHYTDFSGWLVEEDLLL